VNRPKELGIPAAVADRAPDLRDQPGQTVVAHERLRPDTLVQLRLRQRLRTFRDQDSQQLEGLEREMHRPAVADDLPRVDIDGATPERDRGHRCAMIPPRIDVRAS
jgi:hypothetical protein